MSDAPTPSEGVAPGWYQDELDPESLRYWDGRHWTSNVMMKPQPPQTQSLTSGVSTWKGIRIVAVGILAAVATIWVVYQFSQPSELECSTQRLQYEMGGREADEVHDSCK